MTTPLEFIAEAGESWVRRVADPYSTAIKRDSELHDDQLLPSNTPLHGMVWRLIAHGGEFFAAHHLWMSAAEEGIWLRPSMTIARTAAVAAVRARYVMAGSDRADRRFRALQLMNDEAKGLAQIAGVSKVPLGISPRKLIEDVETYKLEIGNQLEALGKNRESMRTDTDLFSRAADDFVGHVDHARFSLDVFWRQASASAHARVFTWDTGFEDAPIDEQIEIAWSMPAQLLEIAWDSWNEMRGADENGNLG